jgi:hypothetical protein
LASKVFDKNEIRNLIHDISMRSALTITPSLRDFLHKAKSFGALKNEILDLDTEDSVSSYSRNMNRNIFVQLVSEVTDFDSVIYTSLNSGEITANEMISLIKKGDPIASQYISDILRVSRDLIARKARREKKK